MKRTVGAWSAVAWLLVVSTQCRSTPPGFGSSGAATPTSTAQGVPLGSEASPDQPTPLDPAVRFGRLANGLTYYVLRHPVPERRALLWLAVKAGSVLEDDDQRGGAHFIEHMFFRGTRRFPGRAIADFLESTGMKVGPDFNAYTDYDETVYQLTLPTDDGAALLKGVDVLRDVAGDLTFIAADVEKERRVLLEEWRRNDVAAIRDQNRLLPVFLRGSRYADRRVAGTFESIGSVSSAALSRFYRDWYRPDRMAVIAVGDFVDTDIESAIRTRFGNLVRADKPRDPGPLAVPLDSGLAIAVTTDPEETSTSVTVFQKVDRRSHETKRDYRRDLDETLLASMMDSRLAELRDRPDSPFVESSVSNGNLTGSADTLTWFVTAKETRLADAVRSVMREIERVERFGFLPTELARAGAQLLVSAETDARENDKLPAQDFAEDIVRHFLIHQQMPGHARELRWMRELLPEIGIDEIRAAARPWRGDQGRILAISGPHGANLPRAEHFRAMVEAARAANLGPWTDTTFSGPLLTQKPVPGRVVESSSDRAAEATVWRLANGVRVVVKPTSFETDRIEVDGSQPGGSSLIPERDFARARFAEEIMRESGAGELSALDITRALTGKDVDVEVGLSDFFQTVTAATRRQDLETMLQLLHLRLVYPAKIQSAFEVWKAKRLESERRRRDSPDERMNDEIRRVLYNNHPRYRPVTAEAVQEANLDRAFEIWKERFADFNEFTFVFVGSVDLETLKPLVETYLGSLPSRGRREQGRDPGIRYPRATVERSVAAGPVDRSWVWICFTAPDRWSIDSERDARILETVLTIRLFEILRVNAGMVYELDASVDLERDLTENHSLSVLFACAPANVDKLRDTVLSELAQIARNGVGREYLDKAAAQIRKTHQTDLKDNGWWLTQLRDAYRHGDDFASVKDIDATLARVTSDRIKATAARMVQGKPHLTVCQRPPTVAPASR